eukprot:CAMPEP_0172470656 /NCGR_PEP_ID=MMETSP1065-20121228/66899_1 /TAXON_ID=265537 /ORGANISM="Amphiprora paludosa, Strain CCMP125" /LENGTH=206 /DNA_ID=CAMNT_0013228657 /DNA_START=31 /DNA_END=651 /DNA_ORIENTATION=+
MGKLALFSRNKKEGVGPSAESDKSNSRRGIVFRNKEAAPSASKTVEKKVASPPASNEQIIRDYVATINRHESTMEERLSFFASEKVLIKPDGEPPITALEFMKVLKSFQDSFPDGKIQGSSIQEIEPNVVLIDNNVVSGTHTGAPFQPLPSWEPLPPSGKHIEMDPERAFVTLEQEKIVKLEVISLGNYSGAAGVYVLAGGTLVME